MPPRTKNHRRRRALPTALPLALLAALVWALPMTRTPSASAQAGETTFVRRVPLVVNDVAYSPLTKMLYASVPSTAPAMGNSIVTLDPATGDVLQSVFVGSEPNRLALADDGRTLYATLDGAFSIRRFDVVTQTPGQEFAVGYDYDHAYGLFAVADLAVAPGDANLVAVARQHRGISPPEAGVVVFDNGVQRTKAGPGHSDGSDFLAF